MISSGRVVHLSWALELERRKELTSSFWQQVHAKESLLKQKARCKWIMEGDANTQYFHSCVRGRRRRNQLIALRKNDRWIEGVKEEVKNHFQNFYSENDVCRPVLDGIHFSQISKSDNAELVAPFLEEEIKEAVWSCKGDKSPGPDGFNFNFYKQFWGLVKVEVCAFVQEFFTNA